MSIRSTLLPLGIVAAAAAGCITRNDNSGRSSQSAIYPRHVVVLSVNTDPPDADLSDPKGYTESPIRQMWGGHAQLVTWQEIDRGTIEFPQLVISKYRYKSVLVRPPAIAIDDQFFTSGKKDGRYVVHKFTLPERVQLTKDDEFVGKNRAILTINSEPRNARIYSGGKFLGTAPIKLDFWLNFTNYASGKLKCPLLIAVHDGCIPERQDLELEVDSNWRDEDNATHEYATLFLLKRDPDYKPTPVILQQPQPSQERTITIQQQKDEWDFLEQLGRIGIMIKSVQPVK